MVWVGKEKGSHLRYQQYPRVGQVESRVQSRDVILKLYSSREKGLQE